MIYLVIPPSLQKIARKCRIIHDRLRGLDFDSVIQPEELGFDEAVVHRGSPSGNIFLFNLLREMKITDADSILDIGCSKGSALRCMLRFPFNRVDGVEISQELTDIARSNFKRLKHSRVNIYNSDARCFEQYGSYNFFYFYNPFPEVVMGGVLGKLSTPTDIGETIIIYNNPTCHQLVEKAGFKKIMEYPDQWGNGIYVYTNRPSTSRLAGKIIKTSIA